MLFVCYVVACMLDAWVLVYWLFCAGCCDCCLSFVDFAVVCYVLYLLVVVWGYGGVYGGCGLFWLLCLCFFLDYWFGCVLGCVLVGVIAVWDGFCVVF